MCLEVVVVVVHELTGHICTHEPLFSNLQVVYTIFLFYEATYFVYEDI